jgi:hypothetical protein
MQSSAAQSPRRLRRQASEADDVDACSPFPRSADFGNASVRCRQPWATPSEGRRVAGAGHGGAPFQRTLNGASPLKVALPPSVPVARLNTLEVATYPAPCRHVPGREPTYGVKFK